MSTTYDVIVVGAGPGGSTAARHLARAGFKTLLLEKEKMPRYKPCGGGLSLKVPALLDFDFSPTIQVPISSALIGYGRERTRVDFGYTAGYCVMRPQFDLLLAEQAAAAGAEVRDAQPVTGVEFTDTGARVTTRGETYECRFVVGADGVNGLVRRAAGLPPHTRLGVALEAEMDAPSAAIDEWRGVVLLDFGAIAWGYAWIFPKAEHLSVGIGVLVRPGHRLDLRAELERYVRSEPSLAQAHNTLLRGHRLPLGGQAGRYHAARAVLVGDAAGVVDPFTAEGISYAIQSGRLAAEEIAAAFERGDLDLAPYTRRVNREISSSFRYAWWLTQFFYRATRFSYHIFERSEATRNAIGDMMSGLKTYPQMLLDIGRHAARSLLPGRG